MKLDFLEDYKDKTVTWEKHPFENAHMACVHPCKHAHYILNEYIHCENIKKREMEKNQQKTSERESETNKGEHKLNED